jgi:hypothetical protein
MQTALADGSVHSVTAEIASVWKHLLKPRDGLPFGLEWN